MRSYKNSQFIQNSCPIKIEAIQLDESDEQDLSILEKYIEEEFESKDILIPKEPSIL
jgi:hypothetical protein